MGIFEFNVPLSGYSGYKIGGPACYFYQGSRVDDLTTAVGKARREKLPIFILGGGTNILFGDEGFAGLVLRPTVDFMKRQESLVTVGVGTSVERLLDFVIDNSLSGFEWAGGLPGLIGGAIKGNAGAFKGEIKDSVIEVVSLNFDGKPQIRKRTGEECCFRYRDSIFKSGPAAGEIILQATFALKPGKKKIIRESIEEKIKWRQDRQPLDYPNIGSIFKNVDWRLVPKKWQVKPALQKHLKTDPFPVLPAAYLIDQCGLKGISYGGAMISAKHPNFIVNCGSASAADVKALSRLIESAVYRKFGISLEKEVIFV